jgi:hypothetical protein
MVYLPSCHGENVMAVGAFALSPAQTAVEVPRS